MSGLQLGLLDLCHVAPGSTPATALCDMTEVAQLADGLGFARYWLAEHHTSFVAHASPELLIPLVAGMTDRIRVGTAGVLLPYRSPLKVASDFRLLAILFPGRIDLGMGRGRAPDATAAALLFGRPSDHSDDTFARMFGDVIHFLTDTVPPDHPDRGAHGAPFAYALFIEGGDDPEIFGEYRRRFRVGPLGAKPLAILSVAGVCAETDEAAKAIRERDCEGVIPPTAFVPASYCPLYWTCRTCPKPFRRNYTSSMTEGET